MPYRDPRDPHNREVINANARKRRRDNPEKAKAKSKRDNRSPHGRYNTLKCMAKIRGLVVDISYDEYLYTVSEPCYYCGGVLPETGHGVDRINSAFGYLVGNVRPCCTKCNQAKWDMTESEFKEWSLRLFNHWSSK